MRNKNGSSLTPRLKITKTLFTVYPNVKLELFEIAAAFLMKKAERERHRIKIEEIRESIFEYNALSMDGPIVDELNWHYIYNVNCYDCQHIMSVRIGARYKEIKSSLLRAYTKECTRLDCMK